MSEFRRRVLLDAAKLFDVLVVVLAFGGSTLAVRSDWRITRLAEFLSLRISVQNLALFIVLLAICHLTFRFCGLYQSKRLSSQTEVLTDILKAVSFTTSVLAASAILFQIEMITGVFLLFFWLTLSLTVTLSRMVLRRILVRLRISGRNLRWVLIVGTNERAIEFARKIESRPELGFCILGFVDEGWSGSEQIQRSGYSLLCDLDTLPQFLRENVVDEVVIGLPLKSFYERASDIIELCREQGIIVRVLSNIFNVNSAHLQAQFEEDAIVSVHTGRMDGFPVIAKRILDFLGALLLICLFSPMMALCAILIKLTSPGPVLFIQPRVGLNKRSFRLYKFRTMVADAERQQDELEQRNQVSGPVFKIWDDPRVTPVGRFLRKTSLDEVPQLFNVLKGEMSLVGPRPLPIRDYKGFSTDWHRRRFCVRPGLTCLWQVNGRSRVAFEEWMELDLQYIDEWSLWLDLKILLKTIPAVLKAAGAA